DRPDPLATPELLAQSTRQASEGARGHENQDITRPRLLSKDLWNLGDRIGRPGGLALLREPFRDRPAVDHPLRRQPLGMKDGGDDERVGGGEAFAVLFLEDLPSRRVGAWLKQGPETPVRPAAARRLKGPADGGGVVCEIVNNIYIVNLAHELEPPLHPGKAGQ